jgi:hypothetical protein
MHGRRETSSAEVSTEFQQQIYRANFNSVEYKSHEFLSAIPTWPNVKPAYTIIVGSIRPRSRESIDILSLNVTTTCTLSPTFRIDSSLYDRNFIAPDTNLLANLMGSGKTSAQQVVQLVGRWSCQSPTSSLVMLHNDLANLFA